MGKFACELCDCEQFVKSDGFFVCQSCGMKYTAQEMRKLIGVQTKNQEDDYTPPVQETVSQVRISQDDVQSPIAQNSHNFVAPEKNNVREETPSVQHSSENSASEQAYGRTESETKQNSKINISLQNKVARNKPTEKSADKKLTKEQKKKRIKLIIAISVAALILAEFIVGLVMATKHDKPGRLIMSGCLELLVAVILYKVMIHIERYNCPSCGAKRVHHRDFIRTSEVDKTFNNQGGLTEKTIYTHHYRDTYVCPECGETRVEFVTKSGGEYTILGSGTIQDKRRPPKEF